MGALPTCPWSVNATRPSTVSTAPRGSSWRSTTAWPTLPTPASPTRPFLILHRQILQPFQNKAYGSLKILPFYCVYGNISRI